jgi:hypothetical protein
MVSSFPVAWWSLFLSYKNTDGTSVLTVPKLLQASGITPFFDRDTPVASLRRPEAIEHGIKGIKVIAVLTRLELGAWQKPETWFASDRHVCEEEQGPIFPALLVLSPGRQQ